MPDTHILYKLIQLKVVWEQRNQRQSVTTWNNVAMISRLHQQQANNPLINTVLRVSTRVQLGHLLRRNKI